MGLVLVSAMALVISWVVNSVSDFYTFCWHLKINADLLKFTEVKGALGLSKEMKPSNIPSSFGDLGGSVFSEITGKGIENISSRDSNRKNK